MLFNFVQPLKAPEAISVGTQVPLNFLILSHEGIDKFSGISEEYPTIDTRR